MNKLIERSTRLEKAIGEKGKIDELVVGIEDEGAPESQQALQDRATRFNLQEALQ